jgi:arginyl-tRNA synthetase
LRDAGQLYEQDGALWFRSSAFGDEKDRVVQRENGQTTYFASDIAYHLEKFERGFDRVIDVWGADHHGYVPRVKAALASAGRESRPLDVLLVQFAILYRNGERAQMSTRSGEFVTLRELRQEVGNDAARFFYVHAQERTTSGFRSRSGQVAIQGQSRILYPVRPRQNL